MTPISRLKQLLHTHPLITQMLFSGTISAGGDVFTQHLIGQREWDKWRTARFFITVSCFTVPCLNGWMRLLQKYVRHSNRHIEIVQKVIVDQLVFSPLIYAGILTNLRLLEGFSFQESIQKMRANWYDVYTTSLSFLPVVQLFNFYLIPQHYRIILLQIVAFFWNSFLSYKTQNK